MSPQDFNPKRWDLPTVIQVLTLATALCTGLGVVFGLGVGYRTQTAINENVQGWISKHEGEAKERRGEIESALGINGADIVNIEHRVGKLESQAERLADRQSAADARAAQLAASIGDAVTLLNSQNASIAAMQAILTRMERQQEVRR